MSEPDSTPQSPEALGTTPAATVPPIVALGASAGGLDALLQFFEHVTSPSGMAYVVIQHLDPTQKSLLPDLLQRVTFLRVAEIEDPTPVRANVVYVIPPNRGVSITRGLLHLHDLEQPRGLRLPIDVFFNSLAADQHQRAIGVVMSGMGADGTLGLQAIKAQMGLTLAQLPESAQFDSMPQSAIDAGGVDMVSLPSEMPARIAEVLARQQAQVLPGQLADPVGVEQADDMLPQVLALLQQGTQHDFKNYKKSMLHRRIGRRLAVHGLSTLAQYASFLEQNPQECSLLFNELLIGVTSLLRDPDAWACLAEQALPELLARYPNGATLRAWVAGCSTGEEAYSLAMVFHEIVDQLPEGAPVYELQIFATDLSPDAIQVARRGVFPPSLRAEISEARLERFFEATREGYRIKKMLRDMLVFAVHNVILDPPFTRLNLLLCRNLLIYFNVDLQQRLLPLFHYSLCAGGMLVLGSAETVGRFSDLFEPVDAKLRIYRRREKFSPSAGPDFPTRLDASAPPLSRQEFSLQKPPTRPANIQTLTEQLLLQDYVPAAVLVNELGDIVYISGRTGKYLEPAAGQASWNLYVMARAGIRTQLTAALRQATRQVQSIELHGLSVSSDGAQETVHISVRPLSTPKALKGMVLVVFRPQGPVLAPVHARRKLPKSGLSGLQQELQQARDEIQTLHEEMQGTIEELQSTNEELQSTNEEMQSTNEELQSANEELTSSKEEMQSMNEERQVVINELQSKLDDLALAQSDMENLLNSIDIATLFLDRALNVRRFTDKATKVFSLRDTDVGRPLSDLTTRLIYPDLTDDIRSTLRTLMFSEKEIPTDDGRWFKVRVMPYRTLANVIDGAVITLVDITEAKALEADLREAGAR